jgi:tetratricopeptide (TPR) repeat protein
METRKDVAMVLVICLFFLSSCASVGLFPGAKNEFDRGLALFNSGKYQQAIPHFRKASEMDSDFADAYLYLGRSHLNLGKWVEAISPLRTALRLSPDTTRKEIIAILVDALFGAASSELKRGNFRSSIGYFKDVLELQPGSGRAKNELFSALIAFGGDLLSQGNATEAIGKFSEAIKLSPDNATGYLWLAKAFVKNGDLLSALQSAKDAIRIDPTNKSAQSLMRELMR